MDFSALIIKMFIFVVLMVIGYICAKRKLAGADFVKSTNKLVMNVFLTATILNSIINSTINLSGGKLLNVMLILSIVMLAGYVLGFITSRIISNRKDKKPVFELLIAVTNTMYFGLPVLSAVFGAEAVFYCSLSCLPYNLLLYTYGIYRLKSGDGKTKIRINDFLSMPLISTLAGMLIIITKLPVPKVITELLSTMSGATMPMSMIVVGASLGSVSFFEAFRQWRLYVMSFVRLIVCPLIVWAICRTLTSDTILLGTALLLAATPSAVLVSVLSIQYNRDAVYASEGILLSTVLSVFTIPILMYLLL